MAAAPFIQIRSPVEGVEPMKVLFDPTFGAGDVSVDDTGNEAFTTVKCLVHEIHELGEDVELLSKLKSVNLHCYTDTKTLCDLYNDKISLLKAAWSQSGCLPVYFQQRACGPLLRHILRQCYERAVDHPANLNVYPPFSSAVYGETSFELVESVLNLITVSPEDCFIDLGSGVGQVVLQVAASTSMKLCRGIEKADYPALCANRMLQEFSYLMQFYGKRYQSIELDKSDFLNDDNRDKILASSIVFVNNYAFGPDVDHQLMERFKHLNQGAKIISSKSYRPKNFRITDRNLCDLASILRSQELPPMKVSWTSTSLSYTLHTVDRSLLEEYFASVRMPKPRRSSHSSRSRNRPLLMRSSSANHVSKHATSTPNSATHAVSSPSTPWTAETLGGGRMRSGGGGVSTAALSGSRQTVSHNGSFSVEDGFHVSESSCTPSSVSTTSTPLSHNGLINRKRPALTLAQAAIQRFHKKRRENFSFIRTETVAADSSTTECTTPTNVSSSRKSIQHRRTSLTGGSGGGGANVHRVYEDDFDFIRHHNLSVLHCDMLASLQASSTSATTAAPPSVGYTPPRRSCVTPAATPPTAHPASAVVAGSSWANDPTLSTFHNANATVPLHGVPEVAHWLHNLLPRAHHAYQQPTRAPPMCVSQAMQLIQQQIMDWHNHQQQLPPHASSLTQQLQTQLQQELERRELLLGLLTDSVESVRNWRERAVLALSRVMHQLLNVPTSTVVNAPQLVQLCHNMLLTNQLLHSHVAYTQQDVVQLRQRQKHLRREVVQRSQGREDWLQQRCQYSEMPQLVACVPLTDCCHNAYPPPLYSPISDYDPAPPPPPMHSSAKEMAAQSPPSAAPMAATLTAPSPLLHSSTGVAAAGRSDRFLSTLDENYQPTSAVGLGGTHNKPVTAINGLLTTLLPPSAEGQMDVKVRVLEWLNRDWCNHNAAVNAEELDAISLAKVPPGGLAAASSLLPPRERWRSAHTAWRCSSTANSNNNGGGTSTTVAVAGNLPMHLSQTHNLPD